MSLIPELAVSSLAPASIYALLGVGFVILYRGTRVVNFTQGQLAFIGALIFVTAYDKFDHQFFLAAAIAVGAALLTGVLFHLLIMSPLTGQGFLVLGLFTLIFGFHILGGVVAMIWGVLPFYFRVPLAREAIELPAGAFTSQVDIAIIATAFVVIGALAVWLRFARFGIAMRASAENPTLAGYVGVNVQTTATISWALATVTATIAGIASGARHPIDFSMTSLGLYVFPALLIGGMDSIIGVLVGSIVLALVQTAAATYLGGAWTDVTAYIVLLAVLVVRPYGFFGTPEYRRL